MASIPFMATAILGTSRSHPSISTCSSASISASDEGSCLTLVCERAKRVRDLRLQTWGGRESKGFRERCSSRRVFVVLALIKDDGIEAMRFDMRRRILLTSWNMRWILYVGQSLEGEREDVKHVLRQIQCLEVLET